MIRMRLDLKKLVQHQVYTPNVGVTYQGQKVVEVDPHFGVKRLIQYFWCHFQVQTQIFGSNVDLNSLIQSGPGVYTIVLYYLASFAFFNLQYLLIQWWQSFVLQKQLQYYRGLNSNTTTFKNRAN